MARPAIAVIGVGPYIFTQKCSKWGSVLAYYTEYRGFEVHLQDEADGTREVVWIVRGYGVERAKGSSVSRQEAFLAACASIDVIEADPYRFPINLLGYPEKPEGEVVTRDGEILGRWRMSGDKALEFVNFIPEGTDEVLLRDHRIGILCSDIRSWHEEKGQS